ncbi:site-specific integrase [Clostridium tetani]|uniref:tyrosine-type recombinase/integrase n=1 Tax=Clostridium tetani TaxID=1513 RepID=UPI00100A748F|nr:site-specific integrase [Clostridium tetani]RXM75326.1 site-specific integrase [Clostridium tetani]RYU98640.1 site-specific integrase [Clostridium tetani]
MPTYKDKKRGTYYCSFYYTDWTGAKKRKKKEGFKKESEAKQFEREFLANQKNNCDMSFKTLTQLYFEDNATRVRSTTLENKKYIINLKILPYFEKMNVNDITPNHIRKWQNKLIQKGYSSTYLRLINNQISAIFNFAIRYYNLNSSPALKAGTMGKKNAESMQFWTVDEFKKFIALNDKPISTLAFKVLFWTGIRSGELMALTFKDIDLTNKTINVNKTYTRLNREDVINEPKTPKSKRIISISDSLCEDIKGYVNKLYDYKDSDRIFNFTKFFLKNEMQRLCKKSGVKQIRIHDLRHSHASLLIELGFTPLLISERLGHEKVQTTLDTYSHLYPNKGDVVANKLDDLY